MKTFNTLAVIIGLMLVTFLSSCEAIAGIFSAGMGVGIFLVIVVVVVIIIVVMKIKK